MPDDSTPGDYSDLNDAQRRELSEKAGYGSATTPPGDLTSPTRQTSPRVGPDSPFRQRNLKESWRPGLATGWGPYFDAIFPPARVTAWINFKRMSIGVNIARRLWDQREELVPGTLILSRNVKAADLFLPQEVALFAPWPPTAYSTSRC